MIIPYCERCGLPMEWEIDRVGSIALLSTRCLPCDPSGKWEPEPVEVIRKPRGKRPDQFPPIAPVDVSDL